MNIIESLELEEVQVAEEVIDSGNLSELIVYNDDINTFDWVIECFIQVCDHSHTQAEQLSLIVHFNGKAIVKTGEYEKLKPMKEALIERGLSAAIESMAGSRK
ncbi:ATP-dependent Clp protease adaptor ClpS [Portibacter marinus]|uniref:ATP-dependent Clp protease adaptor ClpS n=1 Tax=Portibacter marinus TaxID=2898660 RepID=UPI001F31B3B0|nr:ATP-dependent Clp protease adaptor ClpS [Portibacter marinus]